MPIGDFSRGLGSNPLAMGRLLLHIPNFIKLYWRLFTDKRVHLLAKAVLVVGILYFIVPLDLIPDFPLPVVGWLDDAVVLVLAAKAFIRLCPRRVVQEHVELIDQGG